MISLTLLAIWINSLSISTSLAKKLTCNNDDNKNTQIMVINNPLQTSHIYRSDTSSTMFTVDNPLNMSLPELIYNNISTNEIVKLLKDLLKYYKKLLTK